MKGYEPQGFNFFQRRENWHNNYQEYQNTI